MTKENGLNRVVFASYIEEVKAQNKKRDERVDIGKMIADAVEKAFEKGGSDG